MKKRNTLLLIAICMLYVGLIACDEMGPDPEEPSDTAPSFSDNVSNQTYTVGTAIIPLVLPSAIGGNGSLRYSLTPTVPGLSFDPRTRTLTGTPNAAEVYSMTYRVEDSDSNSSASDADTLTFTITIELHDRVDQPTTPTASVSPGSVICVSWDRQTNLRQLSHYEVQVSGDKRSWYSLRNDGVDWKESMGEVTRVVDEESVQHGAESVFGLPDDYLLHYRVRRVTQAGLHSEWSDVVSACTDLRLRPGCYRGSPQRVKIGESVDFQGVEVTLSRPFLVYGNIIGIEVTIKNESDQRIPYRGGIVQQSVPAQVITLAAS